MVPGKIAMMKKAAIIAVATRNPQQVKANSSECTEFQLHSSQLAFFNGVRHKVFDFTEHKLQCLIDRVVITQQKLQLMALLENYKQGNVAVAWQAGRPIYVKVTHDK